MAHSCGHGFLEKIGGAEMINDTTLRLLKCFPDSFINHIGEFIAHAKANEYFNLKNCKDELEVKCKILEYLSRGSCKTEPFKTKRQNVIFNNFMRSCINEYLNTSFIKEDMFIIYDHLGNGVDRDKTLEFINSGYNIEILEELK